MSERSFRKRKTPDESETKARWWMILLIALPTVLLFLYGFLSWSIPDRIRLISGQDTTLRYATFCNLEVEETRSIQVTSSEVSPNDQILLTGGSGDDYSKTEAVVSLFGVIPLKKVSVEIWPQMDLVPMGKAIGVDLRMDGVLVLGLGEVTDHEGNKVTPARNQLFSGDRIYSVNGESVREKEDVITKIAGCNGKSVEIGILRGGQRTQVTVDPVLGSDGVYKIGLWIRDRAQGIGTLTYVDPQTRQFGAIGHGMTDVDLEELLPLGEGTICQALINHVEKGNVGEPGEIVASLTAQVLGSVERNTDCGIFGTYTGSIDSASLPVAFRDQVTDGDVKILCTLSGMEPKWYDARIQRVSSIASQNIGFTVEITDPELLSLTGGIIQGMSGSPIMQNGRLIGAVTHVLVQDPGKGYGIYIEDMLAQHLSDKAA